jgi:biotin synthase-related radical SAM superfamily protein
VFSRAVIYFPENQAILQKIHKEIAVCHCAAATSYMNTLDITEEQKSDLLNAAIDAKSN